MSRKVFISVLGTGFYSKCKYRKEGFTSSETRFIQQAMLEYYNVREWGNTDCVMFLLTDKARAVNWQVEAGKRVKSCASGEEEPYMGLHDIVEGMRLSVEVNDVSIANGFNEGQMWDIFTTIYNQLEQDDELYLDLTHGFRYLPMLMLVLGNYSGFLKNTTIAAAAYGNFEAMDRQSKTAPIVDLMSLVELQQWTYAAGQYLETGNVGRLMQLGIQEMHPILKDPEKRNEATISLNRFVNTLGSIIENRRLCRGIPIVEGSGFNTINSNAEVMDKTLIAPLAPVINRIIESFRRYHGDTNAGNGFLVARWCLDNGLYQQAATFAHENIVTALCLEMRLNWKEECGRTPVNIAFRVAQDDLPECQWDLKLPEDADSEKQEERREIIRSVMKSESFHRFAPVFSSLNDIRNDINHSGMRRNWIRAEQLKNKISKLIEELEKIYFDQESIQPKLPPLFLNLSNHPSTSWSAEQLAVAKEYGEIRDMAFPQVDPDADERAIQDLSEKLCDEILTFAKEYAVTVHLMGEMGLTYNLVKRLQGYGVRCVYSTTYRTVEEYKDGSKRVMFNFRQFREYGK